MSSADAQKKFHITIGASPQSEINLENDLRLVKAALLYADRVTLCSLQSSMILTIQSVGNLSKDQQMDLFESLVSSMVSDAVKVAAILKLLQVYRQVSRKKYRTRNDILLQRQVGVAIESGWADLKRTIDQITEQSGINGIVQSVEAGLLDLHIFQSTDTESQVAEFLEEVTRTVSDASTYPLFDTETGSLVQSSIREGKMAISPVSITRGKHVALAAHLLQRLPLFDFASIDEILDIRKELGKSLTRFRGAMMKFSEKIQSASWDKEFPIEAEESFYRDVAPAIVDIEEAVKANGYLDKLLRKFADKPLVVPTSSCMALVMSQFSSLPDIVSQAFGVGLSSATIAYDAYREWRDKQREIERNGLFFYYRAGKALS